MAAKQIRDMTLEELGEFVERIVDRRLRLVKSTDTRTTAEVNESIRRNRWTPPPGAKSSLELLREDRDA